MMNAEFIEQLNKWGREKVPFLFVVDFEQVKPKAWRVEDMDPAQILFDFNGRTNSKQLSLDVHFSIDRLYPVLPGEYNRKFEIVNEALERGDSFLTNLTIRTPVEVSGRLEDCFYASKARYRLCIKNEFVVFSPEIFVQIRKGVIYSYPMKGTIDASVPNAQNKILADTKEIAEHVTMVDLIRNDLSTVAQNVRVARFRYIDEIKSKERNLFQVSSEIAGELTVSGIGDILQALLPAGSVSGAPKVKTCELIAEAEGEPRGYYTGVCGYFDGENLDSGVMIRFIEQKGDRFYYRSGGGITNQSDVRNEYEEALNKIYVPID
jgi:para-aminobenzoate synthetase component I